MSGLLDIETALQRAGQDGGWEILAELEKNFGATPEQRKARELAALQQKALAEAASRVFAGPDGERVLEWLLDQTWRRMIFAIASHPDPQQALLYGTFREGQNALAWSLLSLIARGRAEAPPPNPE